MAHGTYSMVGLPVRLADGLWSRKWSRLHRATVCIRVTRNIQANNSAGLPCCPPPRSPPSLTPAVLKASFMRGGLAPQDRHLLAARIS